MAARGNAPAHTEATRRESPARRLIPAMREASDTAVRQSERPGMIRVPTVPATSSRTTSAASRAPAVVTTPPPPAGGGQQPVAGALVVGGGEHLQRPGDVQQLDAVEQHHHHQARPARPLRPSMENPPPDLICEARRSPSVGRRAAPCDCHPACGHCAAGSGRRPGAFRLRGTETRTVGAGGNAEFALKCTAQCFRGSESALRATVSNGSVPDSSMPCAASRRICSTNRAAVVPVS